MLTPAQITTLSTELQNDPQSLGYAALVTAGSDGGIATLLNTVGSAQVPANPVSKDQFLLALAPIYLVLPTLSTTIQQKWDRILEVIEASLIIEVGSANVQALLDAAVTDSVLTFDQRSQFPATRNGTRAEVLFGPGTIIDPNDVAHAFGRGQ